MTSEQTCTRAGWYTHTVTQATCTRTGSPLCRTYLQICTRTRSPLCRTYLQICTRTRSPKRHVHAQDDPQRHVHAQGHAATDMYTHMVTLGRTRSHPSDMYTHWVTPTICTRTVHTHSPLTRAHKVTQTCIQTGSPSGIETGPLPDIYRHVHAQGHLRHAYRQGHTSYMSTRKVTP